MLRLILLVSTTLTALPVYGIGEPKLPWLFLVREMESSCFVEKFDVASSNAEKLLRLDDCPDDLFVAKNGTRIAWVSDNSYHFRSLSGKKAPYQKIPALNLDFDAVRSSLSVLPPEDVLNKYGPWKMQVSSLGMDPDRRALVHASLHIPSDDTYDYLFVLDEGGWKLLRERHCHRFETSCNFDEMDARSVRHSSWGFEWKVWQNKVLENPYFVGESVKDIPESRLDYREHSRRFSIDEQIVVLQYGTASGPDTGATMLFNVRLVFGEFEPFSLADGQCSASLVGRYILVRQFWGGTLELRDMGTGDTVFGPLKFAAWIDRK